ncbi:OmpA family protein [Magnetospirillum fulvum]|uniref:OmpA family protein n=1 Tax=Magnetospirillum fulvum TaxID=1082 RepID=A0A1H6HGL7_MAGFU|nr:OmpA family protein [Magnetospirillum fulvum]
MKKVSGKITIVGHVDNVAPKKGTTNAKVALSRATFVSEHLQKHGIDAARIVIQPLPDSEPMERVAIITVEKTAKTAAK